MLYRIIILAIIAILPLSVSAKDYKQGSLTIKDPHARPTIGKIKNTAGYLKILNTGSEDDEIISVAAEIADLSEIHTHKMDNGTMMMMKVDKPITVPAGREVEFKSGGLHIMLMGLKTSLKLGESFPVTLTFKKQGKVTITMQVKKPDNFNHSHHHHHSGHNM